MLVMMQSRWATRAVGLLNSAKSSGDIASKMEQMRQLREVLLHRDPSLLPEFAPRLTELDIQLPAAARKLLIEILGEIGKKHVDLLPELFPSLIGFLKDETPPVVRQAILTGIALFRVVFVKVAIQDHEPNGYIVLIRAFPDCLTDAFKLVSVDRVAMLHSGFTGRIKSFIY